MDAYERNTLFRYRADALQQDEAFCDAVATIQGEFLTIHPFREGNARTIKLLTDLLAAQTNRPLFIYDDSPDGLAAYIAGANAAFKRDYGPLATLIREALARSR